MERYRCQLNTLGQIERPVACMCHTTILFARFRTPTKRQNQPTRRDHTPIYVEQIRRHVANLTFDQAITPQAQAE